MKTMLLAVLATAVLALPVCGQVLPVLEMRQVPVQQPPLTISNAHAGWQPPAWAADTHRETPAAVEIPALPVYFQVQNTGQKQVYAFRVMVVLYDAFGDYLDTIRASSAGVLAPQASDYGRWSLPMRHAFLGWTAVYYLEAVRFADGTLWRLDPESVAMQVPAAAPTVRFQAWHIIPDPREVLPQHSKDPQ